jgi:hypothetical protein
LRDFREEDLAMHRVLSILTYSVAGVAAFFGAVAAASALTGNAGTSHPRAPATALVRHFAVFNTGKRLGRTSETTAEPAAVARLMAEIGNRATRVVGTTTASAAVQVAVNPAFTAWALAGSGGACIVALEAENAAVATCQTAANANAGGVEGLLQNPDGTQTIFGLVPNGNQSVSLTTVSGSTETVPVTDNVFEATSSSGFASVGVRASSGAVRQVPAPSRGPA